MPSEDEIRFAANDYNSEAFKYKLTQNSTGNKFEIKHNGMSLRFPVSRWKPQWTKRGTCFPKVFGDSGWLCKTTVCFGAFRMSVCFHTLFHHKDKMEAKSSGPNSLNCICLESRQAKRQWQLDILPSVRFPQVMKSHAENWVCTPVFSCQLCQNKIHTHFTASRALQRCFFLQNAIRGCDRAVKICR